MAKAKRRARKTPKRRASKKGKCAVVRMGGHLRRICRTAKGRIKSNTAVHRKAKRRSPKRKTAKRRSKR